MDALVREDGNMVQQLQASQEQVSRLMMSNEALRHKLKVRPVREIIDPSEKCPGTPSRTADSHEPRTARLYQGAAFRTV